MTAALLSFWGGKLAFFDELNLAWLRIPVAGVWAVMLLATRKEDPRGILGVQPGDYRADRAQGVAHS